MGHLNWKKVRELQCEHKKTIKGKEFHVVRVTDRAVVIQPRRGREHRVSRGCLEKAVRYINQGGTLKGPGDYRNKICDDKPAYAWAILHNLGYV